MRSSPMAPAQQLRQARLQLVERGIEPLAGIDARVSRSWQRSLAAGLSPFGRLQIADKLDAQALQRARLLHHELIRHSEPVMDDLFEQVRHSHSMVILSDPQGVLMDTRGDLDFLGKAERVALTCGASWAESQRGTNAIGTAAAEGVPVEIHGAEHYLERNGFLTCAAAPIFSAQGRLMGVLDLSGEQRSRHPHTLGLVGTAARMIENSLVLSSCRHQIVLQLHTRPEGIGTVAQGLLAFADDGFLVGANRRGLELLGLTQADLQATAWPQLFDRALAALLSTARKSGGRPCLLRTLRGELLHVQVQGQRALAPAGLVSGGLPQRDALDRIDTGDAQWRRAAGMARRVADKSIPLLVLGESGVGKELFARAVHDCGVRRDKPFVALNCAALPESLIESELFGYAPGAFTGALPQGSPGRLREAHGGTLFLDEIGDMPLLLQTRLLRVLQERQVTPLGSGTPVAVDFNLISATHQDLEQALEQGRFRSDLYFRLNGLALRLPALRERSDFEALLQRLLAELSPETELQIEPALLQALAAYRWPGNLRQLHHALRTAVALLEPQEACIGWEHLSDELVSALQAVQARGGERPAQNLRELSLRAIEAALENTRGNVSAAARQLGICRQTLYRKLQEMGRATS